ncbi:MAG: hypothetical protein NT023_01660 [Armatimonadetes bacterium]|nr:hypothetical protein [Armatimonadota bacterium]
MLALVVRPGTGERIAHEVTFSFKPTLLIRGLGSSSFGFNVSGQYLSDALLSYLEAHPEDSDAAIAAISLNVANRAISREKLYNNLLLGRARGISHGGSSIAYGRMLSAFLLRRSKAASSLAGGGGSMAPDPRYITSIEQSMPKPRPPVKSVPIPIDPEEQLLLEVAAKAVKEEPNNAYFLLFNHAIRFRSGDDKVFLRIAESPESYYCNRYLAEEEEAIQSGIRKACGDLGDAFSKMPHPNAPSSDSQMTSRAHNILSKIQDYEKSGDIRTAVALRQGGMAYALMLIRTDTHRGEGHDGQYLLGQMYPLREYYALSAFGLNRVSAETYAAYLSRHGFAKEAKWALMYLPNATTAYTTTSMDSSTYSLTITALYWFGTQWLGIEVFLCFLLGGLVSLLSYRSRFRVGVQHRTRHGISVPSGIGAFLSFTPFLISVLLGQNMGTVPNIYSLAGVLFGIGVLLGAVTLATNRKVELSKVLLSFFCSALLILLTMVFALGLMQTIAFWTGIQGQRIPEGYNHQQVFLGCWFAVVTPVALLAALGAGLSLRGVHRSSATRIYANTFFPACMVFLTLFILLIAKGEGSAVLQFSNGKAETSFNTGV